MGYPGEVPIIRDYIRPKRPLRTGRTFATEPYAVTQGGFRRDAGVDVSRDGAKILVEPVEDDADRLFHMCGDVAAVEHDVPFRPRRWRRGSRTDPAGFRRRESSSLLMAREGARPHRCGPAHFGGGSFFRHSAAFSGLPQAS